MSRYAKLQEPKFNRRPSGAKPAVPLTTTRGSNSESVLTDSFITAVGAGPVMCSGVSGLCRLNRSCTQTCLPEQLKDRRHNRKSRG